MEPVASAGPCILSRPSQGDHSSTHCPFLCQNLARWAAAQLSLPAPQSQCHLQERLNRFTWPRMLEEEEIMRGLSYYGSGTGLRRLAVKLLAGQPVQIVALGGSITGTGGDEPTGKVRWRRSVVLLPAGGSCRHGP